MRNSSGLFLCSDRLLRHRRRNDTWADSRFSARTCGYIWCTRGDCSYNYRACGRPICVVLSTAGFRELLSHIKPWLEVVFSEISLYRELPSVRLELFLHCFLLIVFLLCIATSILHAPIPWVSDLTHDTITGILVGAAVLFVLLTIVSFSVALRSP